MSKLFEIIALATGGIALWLVDNMPAIKKAIANIQPSISQIIPVSTEAPRPETARRVCPPGMYLDKTMGIYTCHDAHGTRQLNPNVKLLNSQWQNAWGLEIDYIDNDEWGYSGKRRLFGYGYGDHPITPPLIPIPSQTLPPPKPVPQILPGPITPERHPSETKHSINDKIEAQRKRQEERKKKKYHKNHVTVPGEEPYPEQAAGPSWHMNMNNPDNDSRANNSESSGNHPKFTGKNPDGSWNIQGNTHGVQEVRWAINSITLAGFAKAKGGGDAAFNNSVAVCYTPGKQYIQSANDWKNVEMGASYRKDLQVVVQDLLRLRILNML